MSKYFGILAISFLVILVGCAKNTSEIKQGKSSFMFANNQSKNNPEIKVWTYMPRNYTEESEVLFVMHGNKRNGDVYRDQWADLAEKNNALLIVPEFSRKYFTEDDNYNMGNMFNMDSNETLLAKKPKSEWSYSTIEPLFDYVKTITHNKSEKYKIFGHSAGAQFVHRFLFFVPNARVEKAVSANAGWYTFPDTSVTFPYGLKETEATNETIKLVFAKQLTILLGTADTNRTSSSLRITPEAMLQGAYRLERGKTFFKFCKEKAEELDANFNWQLHFATNVGHNNNKIKAFAEKYLF